MEKSQIVFALLLPADQEAARTIDPSMGTFYDPSASPIARDPGFVLLFLPTATNVRKILMINNALACGLIRYCQLGNRAEQYARMAL
jgi:hypothetical protein